MTSQTNPLPASQEKRFLNYLLDTAFIVALFLFILHTYASKSGRDTLTLLSTLSAIKIFAITIPMMLIIGILEYTTQKTFGKFITKTKVVSINGKKPSITQIFLRTFARITSFNVFTFFNAHPRGLHDEISKTVVVNNDFLTEDVQNMNIKPGMRLLSKILLSLGIILLFVNSYVQFKRIQTGQFTEMLNIKNFDTAAVDSYIKDNRDPGDFLLTNNETDPITGISYTISAQWVMDNSEAQERERRLVFSRAIKMTENYAVRKSASTDQDLSKALFRLQLIVDEYQFTRTITPQNKLQILNEEHTRETLNKVSTYDKVLSQNTSTSTILSFSGKEVEAITTDAEYITYPFNIPIGQRIVTYIENNKIYSVRYMIPSVVWETYITEMDNIVKSLKIPSTNFTGPVNINS